MISNKIFKLAALTSIVGLSVSGMILTTPIQAQRNPSGASILTERNISAASLAQEMVDSPKASDDTLLIKTKAPESSQDLENKYADGQVVEKEGEEEDEGKVHVYKLNQAEDLQSELEEVLSDPEVEFAQPIYKYELMYTPNDPQFATNQWYLKDAAPGIKMETAWNTMAAKLGVSCGDGSECGGRSSVKVAVIDSGVNTSVSDLSGINYAPQSEWQSYYWASSTAQCSANGDDYLAEWIGTGAMCVKTGGQGDQNGHGTEVTSVIAMQDNNQIGVGVSPNVTILPIEIRDGALNTLTIEKAVDHSRLSGAKVVNMSLGAPVNDTYLKTAIDKLNQAGGIVVVSSGNSGDNTLIYPAANDNTISVGASDRNDNRSNYSTYNSKVDLVSPVNSSTGNVLVQTKNGTADNLASGTSFSAPQVTGVIALMVSINPDLTFSELKQNYIAKGLMTVDIGAAGKDNETGYGRLDAAKAISSLQLTPKIAYPTATDKVYYEQSITITAENVDTSLNVAKVEFYVDGKKVGEDATAPYSTNWTPDIVGYKIPFSGKIVLNSGSPINISANLVEINLPFHPWVSDSRGRTELTYEMVDFNGRLYQSHTGTNNRIYTRSTSATNVYTNPSSGWSGWETSPDPKEHTSLPVSMAIFNGKIYHTHIGRPDGEGRRKIYTRSSNNGVNWTGWSKGPDPKENTTLPIGMVEFNSKLYQVHVGGDNKIYTRSSTDGQTWTGWTRGDDPNEYTSHPVKIAEFDGKLYQVHTGRNKRIYTRSSTDGVNWTGWTHGDDPNEYTDTMVEIEAVGDKLYEVHTGRNKRIYTRVSTDGTTWSAWVQNEGVTTLPVTMAEFDNHLYQGYVDSSGKMWWRRLETATPR